MALFESWMSSSPRMIVYIVFTRILEKIHVESFEIQNEIMENGGYLRKEISREKNWSGMRILTVNFNVSRYLPRKQNETSHK